MARRLRLISNQGAYHVYNRAELGQPIFETDAAKQVFLETLLRTTHRFGWDLPAYAIMTNHFHLIVTTPRGNLSQGMHALQSDFANKHKAFRGSPGHVFQSRYGSAHYPAGPSTARKIDYVHLNPVRAGIITLEELRDYPWTSCRLLRRPGLRCAAGMLCARCSAQQLQVRRCSLGGLGAVGHGCTRKCISGSARPTEAPTCTPAPACVQV